MFSTYAASSGIMRPVREADHLSSTSTEVKKIWIYAATTQYVFVIYE
jgi:hypothetical protein